MKKSIVIMLLLSIGTAVFAQKKVVKKATPKKSTTVVKKEVEPVVPQVPQVDKKIATIPTFVLDNVVDSTAFTDANLDKTKKTIFIYYGPDCGHCVHFAKKMMDSISMFNNTQIVMMSSVDYQRIKTFYYDNKMNDIPFITMGRDPKYAFVSLFDIRQFPSAYLYDEKGKFVKSYSSEVAIADLINY
jgi:thiol-disulfide isomerase/thioredoxin